MTLQSRESKKRLDQALVDNGFFESRARAHSAIKSGDITVNDQIVQKPSQTVSSDDVLFRVGHSNPYVSRAGLKLAYGLEYFSISPQGRICLDLGASTGGFCDVLLRGGATTIYAVDVGTGQLHPSIAEDQRVVNLQKTHAKMLTSVLVPQPPSILVCDVSFISLRKVLGYATALLTASAEIICLIKPQFELGPDHIGKGGIVIASQQDIDSMLNDISTFIESLGFAVLGSTESPIVGGDGNREYLIAAGR